MSEAQDGGTDTHTHTHTKNMIKSKMSLYRKQIINRTSHHANKNPHKLGQQPPQADWNNSRAETTAAAQVISSPLISLGVSQHTHRNIYQLGSSTASDSLSLHAHSQSHFTEHYSFKTDAV